MRYTRRVVIMMKKHTMAKKLAEMELELCKPYFKPQYYDATLNQNDLDDLDNIDDSSSIGDIEVTIRDICQWHELMAVIKEIEQEKDCSVKKELIFCLSNRSLNKDHLKTVANCSNNPQFTKILKNHFLIL